MKNLWTRAAALAVAAAALAAGLPLAPTQAADDFKVEEGYTSLFNGKDLTGWKYVGSKESLEGKTETADKRFQVVDGVIVANEKDARGKGGIRDLYTTRPFNKDFHLKLEFRAAPKADSGVYIRGPQLQVRDYIRRGEQKQLKKFKNDDWNELDITVKDGVATCLCNGEPLSPRTMKVPAKSDKGIGLQAETGKFEFRRIRIKEMP
ncbi:MAG TPA: DUF1080 domain-containing protein [Gemmataceae bacterium]|nr:DUF1080 domain-containing protein [Gemmataceae bacterium]